MIRQITLVIFLCLNLSLLSDSFKPRKFKINIDQDLKPQYEEIFPYYKESMMELFSWVEKIEGFSELMKIGPELLKSQPQKYQEEIEILSEVVGMPVSYITIANMAYEIFCTSMVVNHENTVFMARNFDFEPRDILANLIYEYEAYRNGELVYTATNVFGDVGVININVNGKFGASLDERFDNTTENEKILRTMNGDFHPTYYLRHVAEIASSYDDAVQKLQEATLTTPVYYIIGGINKNEGTVIARSSEKVVLLSTIQPDQWFIVQTNYDLNKPDQGLLRRTYAQNRLNALGENDTNYETVVEDVLGLYPNRNPKTIYTCVFSPSEGYYSTIVYTQGLNPK